MGTFWTISGSTWGQIKVFLEPVWGLLGAFGFISVFFWGVSFLGILNRIAAILEPLGTFWTISGLFRCRFEHLLDRFGVVLGSFSIILQCFVYGSFACVLCCFVVLFWAAGGQGYLAPRVELGETGGLSETTCQYTVGPGPVRGLFRPLGRCMIRWYVGFFFVSPAPSVEPTSSLLSESGRVVGGG